MKVFIVEFCLQWREIFGEEKQLLQTVPGESSIEVEHIGNTAVNELASRLVIDILIGLPDFFRADMLVPGTVASR